MTADSEELTVSAQARAAAQRTLEHWLKQCEEAAADAWAHGRGGYVGRLKIYAYATDEGVLLTVEQSLETELE